MFPSTVDLSGNDFGNNFQQFRGFFIQTRLVADDKTRVGTFVTVDTVNTRLSSCTPASVSCLRLYCSRILSIVICRGCTSYKVCLLVQCLTALLRLSENIIYLLCISSVLCFVGQLSRWNREHAPGYVTI